MYKVGYVTERFYKKDGETHKQAIASCLCGTVQFAELGRYGTARTNVTCEGCGNKTFAKLKSGVQRVIYPYIEVLKKDRKGFKAKRTNLSVYRDDDYNCFVKPNMVQILIYDLSKSEIKLYKNGEDTRLKKGEYASGIMRYFSGVDHSEFKEMITTPETEFLYKFAWSELAENRYYDRKVYLGLIKLFDYQYIQILANAGFPRVERFYRRGYYGANVANKQGKNPAQILGLPKFLVKHVRENEDVTLYQINQLREACKKVNPNRLKEILEIVKDESTIGNLLNCLDTFIEIHDKYKYKNIKKLALYLFREIRMNQGISNPSEGATYLRDYVRMCTVLNYEFEKYPKSLKKDHDVMQMNYKVQESEMKKREFQISVDSEHYKKFEYKKKNYTIISPKEMQDLIKEGSELSHCVASYVDSIITNRCQIYFLRDPEDIDKPLATIEVRGGNVRQARGFANRALTAEEREFVKEWADKKELELNYYY